MDGVKPANPQRAIFAFTHDLRLADHAGLAAAGRFGAIVPVIVIDTATARRLRASPRRAAFYCAAVASLDRELRARGTRLVVRRGQSGPVLRTLARALRAGAVGWSYGYDPLTLAADRHVQSILEEAGLRAVPVHDAPAVVPEDDAAITRSGEAYRAFVPYCARWRAVASPQPYPEPAFAPHDVPGGDLPEPAEFGAATVAAPDVSEAASAAAFARFLDGPAMAYAIGRGVPSAGGTSGLAADLSFGTIGARTIVRAVRERARDPFLLAEERASLRLYLRSFALRDFFLQLAWHAPPDADAPLQRKMRGFRFARSHPALDAWRAGRTGFPLVDAGMRELHATGAMHPRIAAVVASFLCFDLGVDWRIGRDEWDRWLVADAPALATGNWQWVAGVGADLAAYPRIYNPLKAARRSDPATGYIRRWIPELALASDEAILDPAKRRTAPQLSFDLFGASDYPEPVLDHPSAARRFLARYTREVRAASA